MLGYVKPDKAELKVREYEVYTGYYCGVCKSIGKRYGQLPRMALSYDAAFLAIMLDSLSENADMPVQEHCIAHPFIQKKTVIRNKAIDYAADVMLILAWYKLLDDAQDEGKFYAKSTIILLKGIFKKLRKKHPALCMGIEEHLAVLALLEQEKCGQLDLVAEAFSKIMELIFAEGVRLLSGKQTTVGAQFPKGEDPPPAASLAPEGPCLQSPDAHAGEACTDDSPAPFLTIDDASDLQDPEEALARIGYHLGKWIYLMDAADDIEENIRTGAYNPLLYRFSYDAGSEDPEAFRKRIEEDLKFNLYHYLAIVGNCMNSLDIKKNKGIIENVIYFGLNRKTEEIIKGEANEPL